MITRLKRCLPGYLFILSLIPTILWGQRPSETITMVSDVESGSGSWGDPFIIYSNIIEWRLDDTSGPGKESAIYTTDLHMSKHRSCAQLANYENMSWSEIQGRVFTLETFSGTYYIMQEILYQGEKTSAKIFVRCEVPPVKPFSLPFTPPSGNAAPNPIAKIKNAYAGSGSYGNPYLINSQVVKFSIDESTDSNGHGDIEYGAMNWAIYTEGNHPVYSSEVQHEYNPKKTFLYWDEITGTTFEWDTQLRPSADHGYRIVLVVTDQYGKNSEESVRFYYDPGVTPPKNEILAVTPTKLHLEKTANTGNFEISNTGGGNLTWQATIAADKPWIKSINRFSGSLAGGEKHVVTVTVDRLTLVDGEHQGSIYISSNGGEETVEIFIKVDKAPQSPVNVQVCVP